MPYKVNRFQFGIESKKGARRIRIFLSCILLTTLFGIWLMLSNKSTDEMNRESIEAVIHILYTSPDEEFISLISDPNSFTNTTTPEEGQEILNIMTVKMREMYLPYCTENATDTLIFTGPFYRFQLFADTYNYQISVERVEIIRDENEPRTYSFTTYLNYGPTNGEKIEFVDYGSVQCLEEGKISYLRFYKNSFYRKIMELENELSQAQ